MLNQPDQSQIEHSAALAHVIRVRIGENNGWISFEEFMELALFAPGMGYYSAGSTKLGQSGDFITAPLMGFQFAGCLAKQCSEVIKNLPEGESTTIVEFGAGTGQLALDLLMHLDEQGNFPDRYLIIETSAEMKQRQQVLIEQHRPGYLASIQWLNTMPEEGVTGVVIANELLDALPVMRFEVGGGGVASELGVSVTDGQFSWELSPQQISTQFQERLNQYNLPAGYQGEINRQAEGWVRTVGEKLELGVMILIDYGFPAAEFYHWDRVQGTLMCHYQHQSHSNPFFYPGIQDITAHVNFSAVAQAGGDVGMEVKGYCNQGGYLLSLGLLESLETARESGMTTTDSIGLSQEIKKLTLPHEMGELFKVMALSRNYPYALSGFSMQNHSGRL